MQPADSSRPLKDTGDLYAHTATTVTVLLCSLADCLADALAYVHDRTRGKYQARRNRKVESSGMVSYHTVWCGEWTMSDDEASCDLQMLVVAVGSKTLSLCDRENRTMEDSGSCN